MTISHVSVVLFWASCVLFGACVGLTFFATVVDVSHMLAALVVTACSGALAIITWVPVVDDMRQKA